MRGKIDFLRSPESLIHTSALVFYENIRLHRPTDSCRAILVAYLAPVISLEYELFDHEKPFLKLPNDFLSTRTVPQAPKCSPVCYNFFGLLEGVFTVSSTPCVNVYIIYMSIRYADLRKFRVEVYLPSLLRSFLTHDIKQLSWTTVWAALVWVIIIIIFINPLTARVVEAPQMILQPVFSIFPCSPLV